MKLIANDEESAANKRRRSSRARTASALLPLLAMIDCRSFAGQSQFGATTTATSGRQLHKLCRHRLHESATSRVMVMSLLLRFIVPFH